MRYKITWLESKNKDWKMATLELPTGETTENVSINRVGKKGDVFPDFDGIALGSEVNGELWVSPAGKAYLFPPRPDKPQGGGKFGGTGAIKVAMKEKQEFIAKSAENKEESIRISSTARDATLILTTFYKDIGADWRPKWREIRSWLYRNWYLPQDLENDVPFD